MDALHQPSHWVRRFGFLLRWLLYIGMGLWALQGDPFGLSAATDKAFSEQLGRLRAFVFRDEPAPITVVAIDYPSIAALHDQGRGWMAADDWPLTYSDHGRIIRDLGLPRAGEQAPAAIFYDIFFERPRLASGEMSKLGRQLQRLRTTASAPEVYLAGGGSYVPLSPSSFEQLLEPSLAVSAWDGEGENYPLSALGASGKTVLPSAASALYRQLCQARGVDCSWAVQSDQPSMAVQWGMVMGRECATRFEAVMGDLKTMLLRILGSGPVIQRPSPACMPFHQVRLTQLYGDNPVSLRPPHLAPGEPFVVLVGNVMPSLHDYHPTPLYGQVAGVYLHAGALANLEQHGKQYIKEMDLTYLNWLALVVAVSLCMGSVWLGSSRAGDAMEQASLLARFWEKFRVWLQDVAVLLLFYIAFYYFLRATPEGWLSLIALVPFLREVVIAGETEYRKKRDQYHESSPYLASDNTQC